MLIKKSKRPALVMLEDGSLYEGLAFAGAGEVLGEVVFNTGMTGYQEVITDPSYKDQIVTMTYPLAGNYGINPEDMESVGIHLEGIIVREYHDFHSNWQSRMSLREFLQEHRKLGVEGIDTRALTRRIRLTGAMRGIISTETQDRDALLKKVLAWPGLVGRDIVCLVSSNEPYIVETVRHLLGKVPIFGICLGHQLLGQALGGHTDKLKFGHHGSNQPVKNRTTGRIEITSQNHGFTVVPTSLPSQAIPTYENLNDHTSEGIAWKELRAFSVQYHPEAAPGPNDATHLFDSFYQMMKNR